MTANAPVEVSDLEIPSNFRNGIRGSSWLAEPRYMCLLGNFTGDIWHCAAAQILYEYRNTNGKKMFPFQGWWPRTCISVEIPNATRKYTRPADKASAETQERDSKKNGKGAWKYLKSIGLPSALAGVRFASYTQWELANRSLTWDIIHALDQEQEVSQTTKPIDEEFERVFTSISGIDKAPTGDYGPNADDKLIPLLVTTSVVMQLIQYLGVEESQIILGRRLCQGLPDDLVKVAQDNLQKLEKVILKATTQSGKEKVLLFNYRLGQVNTQHDSNRTILEQIKKVAAAKNAVVVIVPQMPKDAYQKEFATPSTDKDKTQDFIFDIYGLGDEGKPARGVSPLFDIVNDLNSDEPLDYSDQRIKVYFWSLVAQTLQRRAADSLLRRDIPALVAPTSRRVIGLIGGRSGSMDLPAFVGVNCFSWDEPLVSRPETQPDWSRWPTGTAGPVPNEPVNTEYFTDKTIDGQVPQFMRLLNEWPLMRVGYLSRIGLPNKRFENTIVREGYRYLDVNRNLDDWLDDRPARRENLLPNDDPGYMVSLLCRFLKPQPRTLLVPT